MRKWITYIIFLVLAGCSDSGSIFASGPVAPDANAKSAAIEKSLKWVWRETHYTVANVQYFEEKTRPMGETGANYEAKVSVELQFPSGWAADCIGPGAAWGCQFLDPNMMHIRPIAAGESYTYTGTLSLRRMYEDDDWEGGPAWDQQIGKTNR